MDLALLDYLIDRADLPSRPNIRYPAGWDVALLPFALNESMRFISPTKTPEYLAAGKPVVSTPIRDVVYPNGEMSLAHIAAAGEDFIAGVEAALAGESRSSEWLLKVDELLARTSDRGLLSQKDKNGLRIIY